MGYAFSALDEGGVAALADFLSTHPDYATERETARVAVLTAKLAMPPRGWIARDGGSVVASCTLTHKPVIWDGRPAESAEIGDTYTAVDHMRRGLFTALVDRTTASGFASGYVAIYGTPNPTSRAGYLAKCGYREWPRRIVSLACPLTVRPPATFLAGRAVADTEGQNDFKFWRAHENAWQDAACHFGFAVDRRADYLEWRYRAVNDAFRVFAPRGGRPGYVVTRIFRQGGVTRAVVADLWSPHASVRRMLLARAVADALQAGARWLTMWVAARSALAVQAMMLGFVPHRRISLIYRAAAVPRRTAVYFMIGDSDNV